MKVRKAESKDKAKIIEILMQMQELHNKNRPDIFKKQNKQEVEKEVDEIIENSKKHILVTTDIEDNILGLCIFKIKEIKENSNLKDAKILYIEKIGVDIQKQRKGIGKLMMDEIKKTANDSNCDRIELNCWSFNKIATEFYKSQNMKIQRLNFEIEIGGD